MHGLFAVVILLFVSAIGARLGDFSIRAAPLCLLSVMSVSPTASARVRNVVDVVLTLLCHATMAAHNGARSLVCYTTSLIHTAVAAIIHTALDRDSSSGDNSSTDRDGDGEEGEEREDGEDGGEGEDGESGEDGENGEDGGDDGASTSHIENSEGGDDGGSCSDWDASDGSDGSGNGTSESNGGNGDRSEHSDDDGDNMGERNDTAGGDGDAHTVVEQKSPLPLRRRRLRRTR